MKTIILFILTSFILHAQNDVIVRGELVTIKAGNEIIINDYIDSARIESPFTITHTGKLNQVPIANVMPLPAIGELCLKNKLYAYNGQVIICIQEHNRTIYSPEDTPNLFNFYREGTDLEWQVNELVAKDDVRIYQGIKYKALMGHTCIITWTPTATLGVLWKEEIIVAGCPDFVQPTSTVYYNIGDCVKFNGKCYESKINVNVWSPSAYPAGWQEIACP